MIIDEEAYLEHHGVKGQKWGVRNNKRFQKQQDRIRRVASGTGSKADKLIVGSFRVPIFRLVTGKGLRGGAQKQLEAQEKRKKKIQAGHKKVEDLILRSQGVNVRDIDFSFQRG